MRIIFSINNFNKLKSNVYNLGLSSANLTKLMLAKKIQKKLKFLKINFIKNVKDPDQRDYFVSNKKIEKKGFKAKIKIEIIVEDSMLELATSSIKNAAYSGKIGDGKIFVSNIEQVMRIRTGEKGSDAV